MESQQPELVQALLNPKAYPEVSSSIEMSETSKSLIFFTGDYVYKVKKAVKLAYLDYTTLEKRQFYCQREVDLNRRLCPETYLGVVSIKQHRNGIQIEGKGDVIDYAVKMRHLPGESMLNVLLADNQVPAEMISRIAQKIAAFHRMADINAYISNYGGIENIITNAEINFSETVKYIGNTISQKSYRRIKNYTNSFIENNAYVFRQRRADGKIRDCHGDLQSTHICVNDDIYVYDCVEYNDQFRYCDIASEVAFLAMDLDNRGRDELSRSFVEAYISCSGDEELMKTLDFYKCYRASVQGKLESFRLDEPDIPEEEKEQIQNSAKRYFELAESYTLGEK